MRIKFFFFFTFQLNQYASASRRMSEANKSIINIKRNQFIDQKLGHQYLFYFFSDELSNYENA